MGDMSNQVNDTNDQRPYKKTIQILIYKSFNIVYKKNYASYRKKFLSKNLGNLSTYSKKITKWWSHFWLRHKTKLRVRNRIILNLE